MRAETSLCQMCWEANCPWNCPNGVWCPVGLEHRLITPPLFRGHDEMIEEYKNCQQLASEFWVLRFEIWDLSFEIWVCAREIGRGEEEKRETTGCCHLGCLRVFPDSNSQQQMSTLVLLQSTVELVLDTNRIVILILVVEPSQVTIFSLLLFCNLNVSRWWVDGQSKWMHSKRSLA